MRTEEDTRVLCQGLDRESHIVTVLGAERQCLACYGRVWLRLWTVLWRLETARRE